MKLRKLLTLSIAMLGATAANFALAEGKMQSSLKEIPRASIKFDAGSSLLSESDKISLRRLITNARRDGTINQVTVAAWSDKALPHQGQKLLDADRDLADARAKSIKDFLKSEVKIDDVDTYNMAESSNWLARTFNTKDAELKSVFGRTGSDIPVTRDEFNVIKKEGGPSTGVAVVEFKPLHHSEVDQSM